MGVLPKPWIRPKVKSQEKGTSRVTSERWVRPQASELPLADWQALPLAMRGWELV
jgi:hypothetical protein